MRSCGVASSEWLEESENTIERGMYLQCQECLDTVEEYNKSIIANALVLRTRALFSCNAQ